MERHSFRLHLSVALNEPEIRRACYAVEHLLQASDILDQLSPTGLEQVRDSCTEYTRGETGPYSEFKRAWIEMVVDHLNEARLREHSLYTGITGLPSRPPNSGS